MPLPKYLPSEVKETSQETQRPGKRYRIEKKLGAGNFGTAYLITDSEIKLPENNQKVLKQICVGSLDPGESVDAMKEAKLLSQLQHENIVQFHESFLDGEYFCIVTEFCEGGDLDIRLREYKKSETHIEESQVLAWLWQLLSALAYMHARRILHRDLKSRNIFLKDNKMKIGDFGISRILMGTSDMASTFVGTPYYMSPEVIKHEPYDEKCDIWSLGCVLYEICSLKHAFEGQSLMAVMMKICSDYMPQLPEMYSKHLGDILVKMLARDPSMRMTAMDILQFSPLNEFMSGRNMNTRRKNNKLTPKERLRIKKQRDADEKFRQYKELASQNFKENERRHRESFQKNFHQTSIKPEDEWEPHATDINTLHTSPIHSVPQALLPKSDPTIGALPSTVMKVSQADDEQNVTLTSTTLDIPFDGEATDELIATLIKSGDIPEDAFIAETLYLQQEDFNSDTDDSDDYAPYLSDTEYKDMIDRMEDALRLEESAETVVARTTKRVVKQENLLNKDLSATSAFTHVIIDEQIKNMRKNCMDALGEEKFMEAYSCLKTFWPNSKVANGVMGAEYSHAMGKLAEIIPDDRMRFLLEQLIYLENEKA